MIGATTGIKWYSECVIDDGSHGYSLLLRDDEPPGADHAVIVGFDPQEERIEVDRLVGDLYHCPDTKTL